MSATDTGHVGGSLGRGWALGHPEKITDFGWRAIHETAAASKAIIEAYYAKAARPLLFRRLFGRRPGSADGGPAFPEGL